MSISHYRIDLQVFPTSNMNDFTPEYIEILLWLGLKNPTSIRNYGLYVGSINDSIDRAVLYCIIGSIYDNWYS